ncbi:hypothetical protein AMTRI_Chr09g31540 [Amborella trichopoda]
MESLAPSLIPASIWLKLMASSSTFPWLVLHTMILLCLDHVPQYTRMDGPRSRIEGELVLSKLVPQELHHLSSIPSLSSMGRQMAS